VLGYETLSGGIMPQNPHESRLREE
jgi:hypothetical protein